MRVSLLHNHYNQKHLAEVKAEMEMRGAPHIRAIWNDIHEEWMAVEGCHRLRAAKELGLTPRIKDISQQKTVTIQMDGQPTKIKVSNLTAELQDEMWRKDSLEFCD